MSAMFLCTASSVDCALHINPRYGNSGTALAACTGTLAALVGWTPPFLVTYGAGFTM